MLLYSLLLWLLILFPSKVSPAEAEGLQTSLHTGRTTSLASRRTPEEEEVEELTRLRDCALEHHGSLEAAFASMDHGRVGSGVDDGKVVVEISSLAFLGITG